MATLLGEVPEQVASDDLAAAARHAQERLRDAGFTVECGAPPADARMSRDVASAVRDALRCAVINVERHGAPHAPVHLTCSTEYGAVQICCVNACGEPARTEQPGGAGSGLRALTRRLEPLGGWCFHSRQGDDFVLQVGIPHRPRARAA